MAKKIKFESFVYRFLVAAETTVRSGPADQSLRLAEFVGDLNFAYSRGNVVVAWSGERSGSVTFSLEEPEFYRRGDSAKDEGGQVAGASTPGRDVVMARNSAYFIEAFGRVTAAAGLSTSGPADAEVAGNEVRLRSEEAFHDDWADSEDLADVDIRRSNESCTSPEMRHIRAALGVLEGKRLLDVGCGLGEASVYFALEGAAVTSMDISRGMLNATSRLAKANGVEVRTHKSAAENLNLPVGEKFDIIYAGNLLHHVDIEATLRLLKPHIAPGGVFVSWDPIAYNPVINVYRAIATEVRTPDEHPLRASDIRLFRREFRQVSTKFFWLTTLLIFIFMVFVQRRDPNKERLWKTVVKEGDRWSGIYRPLSKLDALLLAMVPPLGWLCWNVVIVARDPTNV